MASPIVDKIQKIPTKTRAIGFGVLIVVLLSVYIIQFQIPMKAKIDQLEKSLSDQHAKIQSNDEKIKKLDQLKEEVKTLQVRLVVLTEQLPPESEVSTLLRQIQNLVNQSGLVLKLWRPDRRRMHPSGLYEEIPVTVTLTGAYHNTAALFDRIGKLTRIVNILNIRMGSPKPGKDGAVDVEINCTAMTFSATVKKIETAPTGKKKI
jgi:type IV pilus assembly protein PilO